MNTFRYFLLILPWFFLANESQAQNWHPFPFKVAYYGKKAAEIGSLSILNTPTNTIRLVDALYLDSMVENKRLRSALYPATYTYSASVPVDGPFLGATEVITSTDSMLVSVSNGVFMGQYDRSVLKEGPTPQGGSVQMGIKTILGVSDSVATINQFGDSIFWSKNFGIYRKTGFEDIDLVGVKDLNLGWQDNSYRFRLPSAGDEIHLWKFAGGSIVCNGPSGSSSYSESENKLLRIKVLSANAQGIQANVVESVPGASTGITYDTYLPYFGQESWINDILGDSVWPIGTIKYSNNITGFVVNMGYIDALGITSKVAQISIVDLPHRWVFLQCARMPMSLNNPQGSGMSMWCSGMINRIQYPQYIQVEGGCTLGNPFPSVVITDVKKEIQPTEIKVMPQPAGHWVQFEGVSSGEFKMINTKGQQIFSGKIDGQPIQVSHLPAGLYFYQIETQTGVHTSGKFLKE